MEEVKDPIAKVDMVITYVSDCILEERHTGNRTPEMVNALAALLNARTAAVAGNEMW